MGSAYSRLVISNLTKNKINQITLFLWHLSPTTFSWSANQKIFKIRTQPRCEQKSEKSKYFSFVINDSTTFMYQFKLRTSNNSYAFFNCLLHQNQQISLILSKQLKFSSKSKYCSSMHLKKRSTILKKLGFEIKQKSAAVQ